MAEKRRRRPIQNSTTEVDVAQNHAITLDVEEEVIEAENVSTLSEVTLNLEKEKEEAPIELDVQEDEEQVSLTDVEVKEEVKETPKEEVKEETPKTTKAKKTKKVKKETTNDSAKEDTNIESGSHDIKLIEEYLKEDLCPTTENLETLRNELIDKINTFILKDSMTPEENIKLSHQVTNCIIEVENLISVYNRKARFLKGKIDDESKRYSKGSNAEERKLNAFLRVTNYTKEPTDSPVDLLIYLRVAEDMCEFLNTRLNVLYRIGDNLKSDKYFFEKLEREMKK